MNNLIITTRQSPVRLMVDYVATTILWTLFMDIICFVHILIRNGSADGLLLAKRGQKPTSVLFFAGSGECRRVNCLGAVQ